MAGARSSLLLSLLLLIAAVGHGQTAPPAAEAALGNQLRLSGPVMQQDLSGNELQRWTNDAGHWLEIKLTDAAGDSHIVSRGSAESGQLNIQVPAPATEVLLPVGDYATEIRAMFSESFFGSIPLTPVVSNNSALIQRFARLEVRSAEDRSAGFVQRWREGASSTMRLSWLYADRDVTISGRGEAPGVSGEVELRLKRGWNAVLMTLIYERGRDGRFLLRTSAQPSEMRWIYWELGG